MREGLSRAERVFYIIRAVDQTESLSAIAMFRQLTRPLLVVHDLRTDRRMSAGSDNPPSRESAEEALARLSPHRTHESNWFKALLCAVGLHRWYCPNLTDLVPQPGIRFCRWCPAVRLPRH